MRLQMNQKRTGTWAIILYVVTKMKDSRRSQVVTCAVKVVLSRKQLTIKMLNATGHVWAVTYGRSNSTTQGHFRLPRVSFQLIYLLQAFIIAISRATVPGLARFQPT